MAQTGRISPYEKEYFLADGSRCWMFFAGRDLGDGIISEQKEAQETLRGKSAAPKSKSRRK